MRAAYAGRWWWAGAREFETACGAKRNRERAPQHAEDTVGPLGLAEAGSPGRCVDLVKPKRSGRRGCRLSGRGKEGETWR